MTHNSPRVCLPLDDFGRQLLTIARLKRGLSLRQLSIATGITIAQLSRYESGKCNPTLAALTKLTSYLGLEFSEPTCHVWRDPKKKVRYFGGTRIE
jgi:transcriptional regulator with XRE-family HTH domain